MSGLNGNSEYFDVAGSGSRSYKVTVNYDTGHFCTCRGMLSKKSTFGEDAGRTQGTSCKHVKDIIKSKFDDDWGVSGGKGNPRRRQNTKVTPTSLEPTGRRAAILAQRAKRKERNVQEKPNTTLPLMDRIAALAASR